ncbi:MAG: dehydrogenase [Verrucomicrobiaceae bacterium]|nr:dehydrogenase [Verrucomicrobiaceae bacterium]
MLRKIKNIIDAGRLTKSVGDLEKRVVDLKKSHEKGAKDLKGFGDKFVKSRQDVSALKVQTQVLAREVESLKVLCGRIAADHARGLPASAAFKDAEFQVFSQWGEDGIIQFLLAHVPVLNEVFVEFGVQDYTESNTRFLLMNNLWSGLIMDGSEEYMTQVRKSTLGWRHTLHALSAWVTAENVNELIASVGIKGDIGILSVDIDGVDYWVWKAITVVQPRIVIAEYNSLFGPTAKVTPPYAADFERAKAHYSHVFYGHSLAAIEHLGKEKGLTLVGTNTAGNNAFLVRDDLAAVFPKRSVAELDQAARFREARNPGGERTFPTFSEAQELIQDCFVHDLSSGMEKALKDVAGWR